ncbi:MAG: PAS domain S-box protein [Elusimicrobia bacterium]|nr:PAS domain S-box protein [Elusimicrobiota bacterium]
MTDKPTKASLEKELKRTQREFAAARERYFDLYDLAPAGIFTLDAKGVLLEANHTVCVQLGVEREALVKKPFSESVFPEDRDAFARHLERSADQAAPPAIELRMTRPGAAPFWARVELTLGYDADGALIRRGVLNDITEGARVRQDLVRLRAAVDHAHDGIAIADMEGRIQFVNLAWAKMHGYAKDELLGRPLAMFHTKEQYERDVVPFNKEVLARGSWVGEVGHVRRDGTTFPTWMSTVLLHDADDKVTGLIGMASDMTERRKAADDLARALGEREAILKAIPDIFYRLDADMRLQDWNQVFERVTGFTPEELKGRHALAFFDADKAIAEDGIREAVEKGRTYRRCRIVARSGEAIPYDWSAAALRAPDGRLLGLVGIGRAVAAG